MPDLELRKRRERAAHNAMASSALEGLVASKVLQANLHHYVEGTISLEQMLKAAQARHTPESSKITDQGSSGSYTVTHGFCPRQENMIKKSPPESQGERALGAVMRNARLEAIARRTQAMATHAERLKAAINSGVVRRQELARDW